MFNKDYYVSAFNKDFLSSEPYGLCKFHKHRGYLSKDMIKKHKCIEKNCTFFCANKEKIPSITNELTVEQDILNILKIARKEYLNGKLKHKQFSKLQSLKNQPQRFYIYWHRLKLYKNEL